MVRARKFTITILVLAGCAKGEALDTGFDTDASLETEGIILPDGHMWCVRAVDAYVDVIGGPDQDVTDPDDDDNWVKGCTCVSAEEHTALGILDGDNDNHVTIADNQADDLLQIRNAAREAARILCEELADKFWGGAVWPDTCQEEVDDETDVFLDPDNDYACAAADRIGTEAGMTPPPTDAYSEHYTLSSAITHNSSYTSMTIDDAFFNDVRDNPGWLLDDDARIAYDPSASPPYKFTLSSTSSIAYHLGIRNNDRPVSINGRTLSGGMLDALAAYTAFSTSTSFSFVVKRNGSNVTLSYTVQ